MNASHEPTPATRSPEQIKRDMRIFGVILAVVGGGLAAGMIGWPLHQAKQGVESISVYPKICFAGIALFYWGVVTAILGEVPMASLDTKVSKVAGKHWFFLILGIVLAGGTIYFAYKQFESLGFSFTS